MTTTATALKSHPVFNDSKAEAFAGRLLGALNNSALVLMTSIGHRTGLFDHLAEISPCTSGALAAEAGLAERYVREWLAVMVTSAVVDYEAATKTYHLPAEHAAFLTRASPSNMAVTSQFLGVTAGVEDEIIARFQDGKGLHYHHYGRFHDVMAEESNQNFSGALVQHVLPLVDGLIARLESGIDVVDVGCGGGGALLILAERFPKSRFLGVDRCADAFATAQDLARSKAFSNLTFRELDLSGLATLGSYDLVLAFDAVHDQKDPQGMLELVYRSLKKNGVFLMVDIGGSSHLEKNIDNPLGAFLYMMSCMHCTPISLGQDGAGLGTMWGVELANEMLGRAGFSDVQMSRLPHDIVNAYFVARP
ncbi:MAG TPA: methyltransferase domain-containing protein [Aestuariivirga sp.]|jgi:SAM-dependent methyltransferase|nr:class I SAM-dependent methyltransferase [Hyphomicrobiales bacterium]HQY74621.1 methyltransferase domain-containing protein [Aestuariivirga sp.]